MKRLIPLCAVLILASVHPQLPALTADTGSTAVPKDIVLVLDNSGSMKKNDPNVVAKEAVGKFIRAVPNDYRLGIVIFDEGISVTPLTVISDSTRSKLLLVLNRLDYRGLFTNTPLAVNKAIQLLKANDRSEVTKSIVLLTDGIVDTGDQSRDVSGTRSLKGEVAASAEDSGIKIFGIALSNKSDLDLLRTLAKQTRGEYFWARQAEDVPGAFVRVGQAISGVMAAAITEGIQPQASRVVSFPLVNLEQQPTTQVGQQASPPVGGIMLEEPALTSETDRLLAEAKKVLAESGELQAASESPASIVTDPEETSRHPSAAPVVPLVTDRPKVDLVERQAQPEERSSATPAGPTTKVDTEELPTRSTGSETATYGLIAIGLAMVLLAGMFGISMLKRNKKVLKRDNKTTLPVPKVVPEENEFEFSDAYLTDLNGVTGKEFFPLMTPTTFVGRVGGSGPQEGVNHLWIDKPTIGRRHAIVQRRYHEYWLSDQGSKNGTFVNDERVIDEVCLRHGDRIRFYDSEFEFSLGAMEMADPTVVVTDLTLPASALLPPKLRTGDRP